jgi:hypothetical protein
VLTRSGGGERRNHLKSTINTQIGIYSSVVLFYFLLFSTKKFSHFAQTIDLAKSLLPSRYTKVAGGENLFPPVSVYDTADGNLGLFFSFIVNFKINKFSLDTSRFVICSFYIEYAMFWHR